MTKQKPNAGWQAQVSAASSEKPTIQQNGMSCPPNSRDASGDESESWSDVATMDDMQFSASLDRLLDGDGDSESAHSAFDANSAANAVSTDASGASSASSSVDVLKTPQPQATSSSVPVAASMPQPQRPLFPPPPKKPALGMGPSLLTARLAYNLITSIAPEIPMSFKAPPAAIRKPAPVGQKRTRDMTAVSEDDEERQRRRYERNLKEQERSRRVTEQITYLRQVLSEANVPCKPDKNSTLISVANYIKQLQDRSSMLDEEHKKLLDTIARTNEMVNNQYYQATVDGTSGSSSVFNDLLSDGNIAHTTLEDDSAVFVQGLDYKSVFKRCGIALAVASIDGRFLDCNTEFEHLCGYSRNELLPAEELSMTELRTDAAPLASTPSSDHPPRNLSMFNLLTHDDMEQVFAAMSCMLKRPVGSRPGAPDANALPHHDYWSGVVRQNREHSSTVRFILCCSLRNLSFGFVSLTSLFL